MTQQNYISSQKPSFFKRQISLGRLIFPALGILTIGGVLGTALGDRAAREEIAINTGILLGPSSYGAEVWSRDYYVDSACSCEGVVTTKILRQSLDDVIEGNYEALEAGVPIKIETYGIPNEVYGPPNPSDSTREKSDSLEYVRRNSA